MGASPESITTTLAGEHMTSRWAAETNNGLWLWIPGPARSLTSGRALCGPVGAVPE
jgi:hypothetical protein